METKKTVAVIGAGTSGLVAIKCCLDEGLQPVCYEKTNDIGGLWCFREGQEADKFHTSTVFRSTVTNTSKEIMAFSDFPMPKEFPNYMQNTYLNQYLNLYADKFDLKRHVVFNTNVKLVTPSADYDKSGRWRVELEDSRGQQWIETYDAVLVCNGHHDKPHLPDFPGLEHFQGDVIHTRDYKRPSGYEDKRVLVVGIGNSACDAAAELSRIASKGKFFLISESDADGSFLIHHFLSAYLRGGATVCFLGLAQSFSHYSSVAHRLGLDLSAAKESGQLHFIDGLNYSLELMDDGKENSRQHNPLLATRQRDGSTKELFSLVKEKLASVKSDTGTLLLIDDLSLLVSLGLKPQQVDQFVHYCLATMASNTVVALLHNDASVDDDEQTALATYLRHRVDILLQVEGLSSGYCKDVHGQLTITNQASDDKVGCRRHTTALHYKVLDKTVNFFHIGTSAAVL